MARSTPISINRGEDITLNFTAYTTDTGTTPEDITGWTLVFTVAEASNSATKLITKTCSIASAVAGTFTATLLSADTNIAPGRYWADVYRTNAGYVRCLYTGPFNIGSVAYKP